MKAIQSLSINSIIFLLFYQVDVPFDNGEVIIPNNSLIIKAETEVHCDESIIYQARLMNSVSDLLKWSIS